MGVHERAASLLGDLRFAHRVREVREGRKGPINAVIAFSTRCNLRCAMCTQGLSITAEVLEGLDRLCSDMGLGEEVDRARAELKMLEAQDVPETEWIRIFESLGSAERKLCYVRAFLEGMAEECGRSGPLLSAAGWREIGMDLARGGCENVTVGGGEPLLEWDLFRSFMEGLRSGHRVPSVEVITNGTLLDEKKARYLVEVGVDVLTVSVDGAGPDAYEKLRGKGNFARVVAGLGRVADAKRKAKSAKPRVVLNFVVTTANVGDIPEMIDLAARTGASKVRYSVFYLFWPGLEWLALDAPGQERAWDGLREAAVRARAAGIRTDAGDLVGRALSVVRYSPEAWGLEFFIYPILKNGELGLREKRDGIVSAVANALRRGTNLVVSESRGTAQCSDRKLWRCYEPVLSVSVFPSGKVAPCCFFAEHDALEPVAGGVLATLRAPEWARLADRVNGDPTYESCARCDGWPRLRAERVERGLRWLDAPVVGRAIDLCMRARDR